MKTLCSIFFCLLLACSADAQYLSTADGLNAMHPVTSSGGSDYTTGIVAWYYFNNAWTDSSGNGYTFTPSGSPSFVPNINSVANAAISFNGSSQSANTAVVTPVDPSSSDMTLSVWINVASYAPPSGTDQRVISENITGNTSCWQLTLGTSAGGGSAVFAFVMYASADYSTHTTLTYSTATWYHIAEVWNHTTHTTTTYINGAAVSTTSDTGGYGQGTIDGKLWIGARSDSVAWFNGSLDDMRIYNTSLTSGQVSQIYSYALNPR